ncbi:MAG: acetate kinase [Clostridiales bacterium]|jgi:acetate kinase|nr:acetate kinase [Clostridiales bacterium]MDN5283624.1 acetate kinase [Candidatus Ozemobacter sp.]
MKILVLNCGSSSIKYQLFDMKEKTVLAKGLAQRVGLAGSTIDFRKGDDGKKAVFEAEILDHKIGIQKIFELLTNKETGVLGSLNEVDAVGHRIVHGGDKFSASVLITQEVKDAIKECIVFAPLHNPPNLKGVEAVEEILPNVKQVAVFDTSFHQTMKPEAYIYGIPYMFYEKHRIRRYGFHGTSHRYVAGRAAEMLGKPLEELKLITVHLGNGASVAAIDKGKSMDTSMGHTPLEGLVMGTRCGDIDPALILHIMKEYELTVSEMDNLLNKHSGVLGISQESSDLRDLEEDWPNKSEKANLALDVYSHRIKKYIGAYMAVLNGCDAVVWTAGVGENSPIVRSIVHKNMDWFGIKLDLEKNEVTWRGAEGDITTPDSKVKVLVIPTNEELVIAQDTMEIVSN